MNGIEKITARIDAQTQEEIDRLLADAKEQAAQITAQYRAQAETERASLTARSVFSIVSHVERPSLTVCRDGTRHGSTYPPARGAQGRARTP